MKSQNNEEFKELLNSYCGYFESVSNYTHDNWFQPLKTHELYLGPSHYAQVDCENDMNVIAQYLFQPLQYFNHEDKTFMLWDFMEESSIKKYPIFNKVADVIHLYEKISPEFSADYFMELQKLKVEEIPLKYRFLWKGERYDLGN